MIWQELSVVVLRRMAGAVSKSLMQLGAVGVQEDFPPGFQPRFRQPWEKGPQPPKPKTVLLKAWFAKQPSENALRGIEAFAKSPIQWSEQREEDWAQTWKENFDTLHISERLVITPPWKPIPNAVVIEPGNAFGTGDHPTTRACLVAIDRLAQPGQTLLDVGCGSGILALAAARLGMKAEGIDIDPDAVRSAAEAAVINDLPVAFHTTSLLDIPGQYDLVVANLFAEVLVELAPDLQRVAKGPLVFAGILSDRAHLVKTAFAACPLLEETQETDWTALVFSPKPNACAT